MNRIECYSREQLQQYLLGRLSLDVCEEISQHLDRCGVCEDTIVGLDGSGDTLVDLLADSEKERSSPNSFGQFENAESDPLHQHNIEESPEFLAAVKSIRDQNFQNPVTDGDDSKPNPIGIRIGDYEIQEKIATGGMGSVFRARHTRLEKSVAIKILPDRKMQNAAAIARFTREMKIIGQMDHPTMVSATDAGESKGTHYLVMELVDGLDLARIVRLHGPLNISDACELARRVALGLQYGHEQGVIHRDVKPSNLMLTRDGNVKILDLGLATLGGLTGTVDELTTVGQLMGTLDYMAPEQCGNEFTIDQRTDVYGLGATLYKLITGLAPYSSDAVDTPLKKLKAMAIESPTPIQERRRGIPDELAEVVSRCIERHPDNRFDSAQQLADTLEQFCEEYELVGLHENAEQVSRRSRSIDVELPEKLSNAPSPGCVGTFAPAKPAGKLKATSPRLLRWITAALFLGLASLLTWNGITIYLDTIAGELVIDSEVDNIVVSVIQDEKPTKEISIDQGPKSTKLRAGKYRVEIKGESDGLIVKNNSFELKKGDKVVARISKRAPTSATPPQITGPKVSSLPRASSRSLDLSLATSEEIGLQLIDLDHAAEVAQLRMELASENLQRLSQLANKGSIGKAEKSTAHTDYQIAQREYYRANKKRETAREIFKKRRLSEMQAARLEISELNNSIVETEEALARATQLYERGLASNKTIEPLKLELKSLVENLSYKQNWFDGEYSQLPRTDGGQSGELRKAEYPPTSSNGNNPSKNAARDLKQTEWPTYEGLMLPEYVESQVGQMIRSRGQKGISGYEKAVTLLSRKSPPEQVTRLIKQTIDENRHEVSLKAQMGIIKSILPLCASSEATAVVFDRITELVQQTDDDDDEKFKSIQLIIKLSDAIPENQTEEFEKLFVELAKTGSLKEKHFAIGSLNRYLSKSPPKVSSRFIQIGDGNDEGLSADWLTALFDVSESTNESLALQACRALAWNWPNESRVLDRFAKLLQSPHSLVKRAAIEFLAEQNPMNPDLIESISNAVDENIVPPTAFVRAIKNPAAAKAIEEFMLDPKAGSNEISLRAESGILRGGRGGGILAGRGGGMIGGGFGGGSGIGGDGKIISGNNLEEIKTGTSNNSDGDSRLDSRKYRDWSERVDLIRALGGQSLDRQSRNFGMGGLGSMGGAGGDGGDIQSGLSRKDAEPFLPLLRRELEQASFGRVLEATWASIGYITREPTPKLVDGRTLNHWTEVLKQSDLDPSQHAQCLQAIDKLADSFSIPLITSIAKSFHGDSFDVPIGKIPKRGSDNNRDVYGQLSCIFDKSSSQNVFIESLDHLEEQDSMFALFVLGNFQAVSMGGRSRESIDSPILRKSRRFARGLINSPDPKLRRRALFVATRNAGRSANSEIEMQPIIETLSSESATIELKLSLLDSLTSLIWWEDNIAPVSRFFEDIDDPQVVSTLLTLASKKSQEAQIHNFILRQLEENRDYLDESHRPMALDLWNGPIDTKPAAEDSGITLFEKIVNILDALETDQLAIYQPKITRGVKPQSPIYQQRLKAIENLVARYEKSEGATKRKLERILKTLAPDSIDVK